MLGADFRADGNETVLALDSELGNLLLQADLRLGKMLALRLVDILLLGLPGTKLHCEITIACSSAVGNDLAAFQGQNGHGNVTSILLKQAGHPDFLCDNASAHRHCSYTEAHEAHPRRSEEHTSELQSLMRISYDVFCLK